MSNATSASGPPDLAAYRDELKQTAEELIDAGRRLTVAEGKNPRPMGPGWQSRRLTAEQAAKLIDATACPTIGVMLGADSGVVDFDIDSEADARAMADLFDGDPPPMPCYSSGRDGGRHYWAAFPADLADKARGVINYTSAAGDTVRVAVGGGAKGGHSVCPPSYHATDKDPETGKATGNWRWTGKRYAWLPGCSPDDIDPPELPAGAVAKLLAAVERKSTKPTTTTPTATGSGQVGPAVDAMLASTVNLADGADGSKRLFCCACRAVEHNLSDHDAVAAVRQYAAHVPFPKEWTDDEVLARVRDAEKTVTRGAELIFSNGRLIQKADPVTGKVKTSVALLKMPDIRAELDAATDRWPRRVGSALFIDDAQHGIGWLDNADAVFGWIASQRVVRWHNGDRAVTRAQLLNELRRTAQAYETVEKLPHFPPMADAYYACPTPKPGDGEHLRRLVSRFTPSTTIDRDLIAAAIVTAFWGGRPGSRPAFVITSDSGRGAGKTALASMIGHLAGGLMAFEPGEDIEKMKQRLLNPEAVGRRVCLIDNVKRTRFSWGELEALVTTPTISGKRLYVGEAQRPNTLSWVVTLNGVALSTDLAQRSVIVKLDRPTYSGNWRDETFQFIDEHRDALLADIAAFFEGERWPLEGASRWGEWERDILSRLPEPGEAQAVILERQAECDADGDDGAMVDEYVAEKLAELHYDPQTAQVRIPNRVMAGWYVDAMGEPMKTTAVTRRLKQMADEGQVRRLKPDPSRSYGRCFIFTGPAADVLGEAIDNDIEARLSYRV